MANLVSRGLSRGNNPSKYICNVLQTSRLNSIIPQMFFCTGNQAHFNCIWLNGIFILQQYMQIVLTHLLVGYSVLLGPWTRIVPGKESWWKSCSTRMCRLRSIWCAVKPTTGEKVFIHNNILWFSSLTYILDKFNTGKRTSERTKLEKGPWKLSIESVIVWKINGGPTTNLKHGKPRLVALP